MARGTQGPAPLEGRRGPRSPLPSRIRQTAHPVGNGGRHRLSWRRGCISAQSKTVTCERFAAPNASLAGGGETRPPPPARRGLRWAGSASTPSTSSAQGLAQTPADRPAVRARRQGNRQASRQRPRGGALGAARPQLSHFLRQLPQTALPRPRRGAARRARHGGQQEAARRAAALIGGDAGAGGENSARPAWDRNEGQTT